MSELEFPSSSQTCLPAAGVSKKERRTVSFGTPESLSQLGDSTTALDRPEYPKSRKKMTNFQRVKSPSHLGRLQQIDEYYTREGIKTPPAQCTKNQGHPYVYPSRQPQPANLPAARTTYARPSIILTLRRKTLFSNTELTLPSFNPSFDAAIKTEAEIAPTTLDVKEPTEPTLPKAASKPFMDWFDIFIRDETDPAIVYNIRKKGFRAGRRGKLRHADHEQGLMKGTPALTFEVDNPPLLCDGRMIVVPLPKFGGTVTVKWRQLVKGPLVNDRVYLREREVTLPAWVVTLRATKKIEDLYVERI